MMVVMETERLETLDQVGGFLAGRVEVEFEFTDRESAYGFIRRTLVQFEPPRVSRRLYSL